MTFVAYKITRIESGKAYIGVTTQKPSLRWSAHCAPINAKKTGIGRAIAKYGRSAFNFEVIACATGLKNLLELERILIAQDSTLAKRGYNLSAGGDGVYDPCGDTRAKMSASAKARKNRPILSDEARSRISAKLRGHGFSNEALAKMSAKRKGKCLSDETRAKLSVVRRGRRMSEECRAKHRSYRHSDAAKAKMSGRERSDSHCANISAGAKKRSSKSRARAAESLKATWARRKAEMNIHA